MNDDVDIESFWLGIVWGILIVLTLVRFEMWLDRPRPPAPVDPFDALRWEVLRSARDIIEGELTDAA